MYFTTDPKLYAAKSDRIKGRNNAVLIFEDINTHFQ